MLVKEGPVQYLQHLQHMGFFSRQKPVFNYSDGSWAPRCHKSPAYRLFVKPIDMFHIFSFLKICRMVQSVSHFRSGCNLSWSDWTWFITFWMISIEVFDKFTTRLIFVAELPPNSHVNWTNIRTTISTMHQRWSNLHSCLGPLPWYV